MSKEEQSEIVYIVMNEQTAIAVFKNSEKALKYKDLMAKVHPQDLFYIKDLPFKDPQISLKTELQKFYTYTINTDDSIELADDYNTRDRTIIMNSNTEFVSVQYNNLPAIAKPYYTIEGHSIFSYTKARELAIKKYKELNNIED